MWDPEHRVGLEYHGNIWHSSKFRKGRMHHRDKALAALDNGIRLFQVFSSEWKDPRKRRVITSLVQRARGQGSRLAGARHFMLRHETGRRAAPARDMLRQWHLQGAKGKEYFWLEDEDGRAVAVMSFGRRSNRGSRGQGGAPVWEVDRYADCGAAVPGGRTRLFAAFVEAFAPREVVSFVDLRFFTASGYRQLGFEQVLVTPPNYWYVDSRGDVLGNRVKFQKHKLKQFLGAKFDPGLSEVKNMEANGYYRLFDAGNLKLVWRA